MEGSLNPCEVLLYLNQLGYQNIPAPQLKEFLQDLKKLIKYELKQKAPKQKLLRKHHENYISVQIKNPRNTLPLKEHVDNIHHSQSNKTNTKKPTKEFIAETSSTLMQEALKPPSAVSQLSSNLLDTDIKSIKGQCNKIPKATTHRPTKISKSDPVSLYHYYQELWKKQKIPGEDNHNQLRSAIRKRFLVEPRLMSTYPHVEPVAKIKCRI